MAADPDELIREAAADPELTVEGGLVMLLRVVGAQHLRGEKVTNIGDMFDGLARFKEAGGGGNEEEMEKLMEHLRNGELENEEKA